MSNRYHVNPETGEAKPCSAEIQCRFGGDAPHFDTKEEAQGAAEKMMAEKYGSTTSLKKDSSDSAAHTLLKIMVQAKADVEGIELDEHELDRGVDEIVKRHSVEKIKERTPRTEEQNAAYITESVDTTVELLDEYLKEEGGDMKERYGKISYEARKEAWLEINGVRSVQEGTISKNKEDNRMVYLLAEHLVISAQNVSEDPQEQEKIMVDMVRRVDEAMKQI